MASTLAGLLTPITPSAGGEPTGPMMNFTLSWLTSRSAATLPPWPVYWSSYMISSSAWGLPPTLMPPAALRSATASSMPRWAARPQAVPPPDSGPMPPILTTSCACAVEARDLPAIAARVDVRELRRAFVDQLVRTYLRVTGRDRNLNPLTQNIL